MSSWVVSAVSGALPELHISVRGSNGPWIGRAQSSVQWLSLRASPKPMETHAIQRGFYPLDVGPPQAQGGQAACQEAPGLALLLAGLSSSFSKPLLTLSWQGLPGPFPAET